MFIISKLITSNILRDLSKEIVHKRVPLKLSLMSTMGAYFQQKIVKTNKNKFRIIISKIPKWVRKCLTNSMPSSPFFQNFTWPSALAVMTKSVLFWFFSFKFKKLYWLIFFVSLPCHNQMCYCIAMHITLFIVLDRKSVV